MSTRRVWQVVGNPQRAFESIHSAQALVHLSPGKNPGWPRASEIDAAIQSQNPDTAKAWPLGKSVAQAEHLFRPAERFSWVGGEALIWKNRVLD
jgi:hypothetical protein